MDPSSLATDRRKIVISFDLSYTHFSSILSTLDHNGLRCAYLVGIRYSTLARSIAQLVKMGKDSNRIIFSLVVRLSVLISESTIHGISR